MSLKKINKLPDVELLRVLFKYESGKLVRNLIDENLLHLTGFTIRTLRKWNSTLAGFEASHEFTMTSGTKTKQVRINGKMYYVHRIIFKLCTGEEPDLIDHINGNSLDNRLENLRSVDNTTNSRNAKRNKNNTSGITGVSWSKLLNKWEAYIWDNSIKLNLGSFSDLNEAIEVRKKAEQRLNYHENHGRIIT